MDAWKGVLGLWMVLLASAVLWLVGFHMHDSKYERWLPILAALIAASLFVDAITWLLSRRKPAQQEPQPCHATWEGTPCYLAANHKDLHECWHNNTRITWD